MKIIAKILLVLFNLTLWRGTWRGSDLDPKVILFYICVELIIIWILI